MAPDANKFDTKPEIDGGDRQNAQHIANDGNLLDLGNDVFALRQVDSALGQLLPITKHQAHAVAQLYEPAAWDKKWTPTQLKLLLQTRIVTPEVCFPCALWEKRGWCEHKWQFANGWVCLPWVSMTVDTSFSSAASRGIPATSNQEGTISS